MWQLGILAPLLVIGIIVGGIVVLIRGRGAEGWSITFPDVLLAYVYTAMFVSVFLTATGGVLLIKAGLSEVAGRDFSYRTELEQRYMNEPWDKDGAGPVAARPEEEEEYWVNPSEEAIRNDIAAGVTLLLVGPILFGVHAVGGVLVRRRRAQGERFISRAFNLLGLAGASIIFLGSGASAVNDLLRRYVLEVENVDPWQYPRPGGELAFLVVFLPLALWFGWRVWQEFALESPRGDHPVAEA